ncbi:Aminotransferase-like plant mobile domain family protein [Euphorbia peplus]|nr:Aminotransferase-like plant mobile domain family protein [Euphorbia peplus]
MEKSVDATIVESIKDLMISPTANLNAKPILRTAYFLKPSLSLNDQPSISELPSSLSFPSLPPTFDPKKWPLIVNFHGWRNPSKNWKEWVQKMASLHADTWKKSGIFEAIFNSTYELHTHSDLILGVAERWLPDTNSFVFPWGEATVTLEDMLVAGYSVLGSPVVEPLDTEESKAVRESLVRERKKIIQTRARKACQATWLKLFMDSGTQIEHEAFLSLWLSRFVLPTSRDVIRECVFPIAIHLARGTRIALAPAVLASIYRDLSLLKQKIVSLTTLDAKTDEKVVATTYAPFQLVLIWVWERFLKLSPKPNLIKAGETRFAQWNNGKCNVKHVRSLLDASKMSFSWRPYTKPLENWRFPKFYREEETWVFSDSDLDDDLLSFVMCLRVSELVGLESKCLQQYLPHRVARQFGFDQDVPDLVVQSSDSSKDAWSHYIRPFGDVKCFIPSCLFEKDDVTAHYSDWWNTLEFPQHSNLVANVMKEKKKSAARTKEDDILPNSVDKGAYCDFITSKSSLRSEPIVDQVKQSETLAKNLKIKEEIGEINNQAVPPGFPSKRDRIQVEDPDSDEEDNFPIAKILKSSRQCGNWNNSSGTPESHSSPIAAKTSAVAAPLKTISESEDDCNFKPNQLRSYSCSGAVVDHDNENVGVQLGGCQSGSSSVAGNDLEVKEARKEENMVKEKEKEKEKEDVESANVCVRASLGDYEKNNMDGSLVEAEFMALECRIEKLEKLIAATKANWKL